MLTKLTIDRLLIEFDKALKTVSASAVSQRPFPDATIAEASLSPEQKRHAAALMRINHCGEVCAQGLYNGQALTASNPNTVNALQQAASEETEHLAWCEQRIQQLGGRTSLLNPLWYAGSFALGALAGALGDRWNLGFLAETEKQVQQHLQHHLAQLSEDDAKTRAILQQMQQDEAQHAQSAIDMGAAELPQPVKQGMQTMSKLMTTTAYYI